MRRISADHIYTIATEPLKNGVVTIDSDGTVVSVQQQENSPKDDIEYYEGIICPGFINTHCHLELSHFHKKITEQAGMTGFIKELISKRPAFTPDHINEGILKAEEEMLRNGIVAVGDISNDNSTFRQKGKRNLRYHTFIEVFDLNPSRAAEVFSAAILLKDQLQAVDPELSCSIVPHAPYTVSSALMETIRKEASGNNAPLCIHNQESEGENELFISGSGPMFEAFQKMGVDMKNFPVTGSNSLQTILPKLQVNNNLLLVHNTFSSQEDLRWAEEFSKANLFWCTCPNANLYIENRLPDYHAFIKENVRVTIGTDSLASNKSLSVLDELKTITKHYPGISMQQLLTWSTKNGADFLGYKDLGTIEKGKKPGINLLKNLKEGKIWEESGVLKLA
jgi:aminodeoxyfutalosine deaminase